MRSLEVAEVGGRYEACLVEVPDPEPRAGESLIRVSASGVNRADLWQIAGQYPPPPGEPEIPGLEVSGTIASTGEPVCALLAGGGHAELVAAPEGQVFRAPRGRELVVAAGIPEAFLTAFVNLVHEARMAAGETLLVHAGASGVGLAAIAVGKLLGARVAATTRSASKLPALREAGADLALDVPPEELAAAIESSWGKGAVDVVLDPVGAATLAPDLRVLATGGRIVSIATLSGACAELDLGALMARRARLIGSTLRSRSRAEKAALVRRFSDEILPAFDSGRLHATVDSIHPAQDAAPAFERMRANGNVGKILLDWSRPRA